MACASFPARMPLTARRRPTAQPCVRWYRRWLAVSRSSVPASSAAPSSARTSSSVKRSSRWRNSASSPCARSRGSEASGGSVRLASTMPQCGGRRSSSRSRNSNTAGSLMRWASSTTMRPRSTSHAASALSRCVATAWRSPRLPPALAISASGSIRQGGSSGSSAAIRQASRPSGSSSTSAEIHATAALEPRCSMRRVSAAVLPKPAGAATRTRRRPSAAHFISASSRSRATMLARARGGWILVSAKLCDGEAKVVLRGLLCGRRCCHRNAHAMTERHDLPLDACARSH